MRNQPIETTCRQCGGSYKMHAYRLKNGTGHFCSRACYLTHRWGGRNTCQRCQKPLTGEQQRFCGEQCRREHWNQNGYRAHKKASNWRRKLALIAELGGRCVECGMDDMRALQIDHIDPSTKIRPEGGHWSWCRRFKDWEANKGNLRLLCANCHSIHTWEQRGFGPDEAHSKDS